MTFEVQEDLTVEGQKLKEIPIEQQRVGRQEENAKTASRAGLQKAGRRTETPSKQNEAAPRVIDPDLRRQIEENLYLNYKQKLRERFVSFLGKKDSAQFLTELDLD
jgi:hypothetical protein